MIYDVKVLSGQVNATLTIPGSKSITNRALLIAALAHGVSELSNVLICEDTVAFSNALHKLGIMIQLDEENQTCIVGGAEGRFPRKEASIWCNDAGTAARFLIAAAAGTPGVYFFDGSSQLQKRPLAKLLQILTLLGAKVDRENLPLTLQGAEQLAGGTIEVNSSQTGQYVSALLMMAPFTKKPLIIKANNLVSESYVNMTAEMMGEFGVSVRRLHQTSFTVPVPQRYLARNYQIEPDFSTASYFFAAAALTSGEVRIPYFDLAKTKQGDAAFLTVLEKMGCKVEASASYLSVKGPPKLYGINVNMCDFSDTFMTLSILAPFAETPTTMTNIGHTRFKESNRISAMRQELEKCGVRVEEGPDWLKVYPSKVKGALIHSHFDHRIAMAFAILGLRIPGIRIQDAECVSKTCPGFFQLVEKMIADSRKV